MADSRAAEICRRLAALSTERGVLESHWQEIADIIAPFRADFTATRSPGEKRMSKIFDGTPGMAAEHLAHGLWGMLTNSATKWFSLKHTDEALDRDYEVRRWMDAVTGMLQNVFNSGGGRFYHHAIDTFFDLSAIGTACMYVEENVREGRIEFANRHMQEVYLSADQWGTVNTVIRRYRMQARNAVEKFGDKVSPSIRRIAEKTPYQFVNIVHAVIPVEEWDGELPPADPPWRFASLYLCQDDKEVLEVNGFRDMPYMTPRWSTRSRNVYGDSPGMMALPDAKMLNTMSKTTIEAAQLAAKPPILAPDREYFGGGAIQFTPGGIIYSGMDAQGRRMIEPFRDGADIGIGLEMENQRRTAIREAFYYSLLLMSNGPTMTATEALIREEEKLRLMGPMLARVQAEFLDPLIDRVFGILLRAEALPELPRKLLENSSMAVEYVSPLARAQRTQEAGAIMRGMESLGAMASMSPDVLDIVDFDEAGRALADAYGWPADLIRDPKSVAAARQQKQMMQAAQMAAAAAPGLAKAGKDTADAQQTMAGA